MLFSSKLFDNNLLITQQEERNGNQNTDQNKKYQWDVGLLEHSIYGEDWATWISRFIWIITGFHFSRERLRMEDFMLTSKILEI